MRGRRALSQTITRAPFLGEPPWRLAGQPGPQREARGAARRPVPSPRSAELLGRGQSRQPARPGPARRCSRPSAHLAGAAARFERIFRSFHSPAKRDRLSLLMELRLLPPAVSMVVYFLAEGVHC